MNLRLIASALLPLFVAATASANAVTTCWESSGERYNVAPALLYAIAKTESGLNPRAINKSNANGSEDVGLMQINSLHFPVLAKHGITREQLFDPCTSIEVGAWILAQNAKQLGYNWNAVGAYNASSPDKRLVYAQKVYKSLMVLSPSLPASGNKRDQSVAAPILVKSPNEKNR